MERNEIKLYREALELMKKPKNQKVARHFEHTAGRLSTGPREGAYISRQPFGYCLMAIGYSLKNKTPIKAIDGGLLYS